MANVLAVVTGSKREPQGSTYVQKWAYQGNTSYVNGTGDVFTAASFGFNRLKNILNVEATSLAGGNTYGYWIVPTYDLDGWITSFQFRLGGIASQAEVVNATDTSAATYVLTVEGE